MTSGAAIDAADEQTQKAVNFVGNILQAMGLEASVAFDGVEQVENGQTEVKLAISGADSNVVIGKKGLVLDALQYLVSRVANRPGAPRRFFNLDADGFRANHESRLSDMAKKLALRVAKEGKVVTFDPMSARDRRVVHRALSGIEGVKTESSGEEPNRRVHIMPAGGAAPAAT
jgi:spoIIIJ-associated protein